jgi:hypothetical protein
MNWLLDPAPATKFFSNAASILVASSKPLITQPGAKRMHIPIPRVSAEKYIKPVSNRAGPIVAATLLRGPRHQQCKYDRNEKERGHISRQMTALCGIVNLNAHDRRMKRRSTTR